MNSLQPDATVISNIKCKFATEYSKKLTNEEYFIRICNKSILDNKSFEETVKEKYLQVYLLENIQFVNKLNEYGKEVINCDLNKIYNLQ